MKILATQDYVQANAGGGGAFGAYSSRPVSGSAGDVFTASENGQRFLYTGSIWRPIVGDGLGHEVEDITGGSWSWFNQGASTVSWAAGRARIVGATALSELRGRVKVAPTPATMTVRTRVSVNGGTAPSLIAGAGAIMTNASTGRSIAVNVNNFVSTHPSVSVHWGTSGAILFGAELTNPSSTELHVGLRVSGTDVLSEWSEDDGVTWTTFRTDALASLFPGGDPDSYGVGLILNGTATATYRSLFLST